MLSSHKDSAKLCVAVLLLAAAGSLHAQQPAGQVAMLTAPELSSPSIAALPDSPGAVVTGTSPESASADAVGQATGSGVPVAIAPKSHRLIKPDETAVPLSGGDKLKVAVIQRFSFTSLASTFVSAGYAHVTDSRPHFGTDRAGFGERLGGAEVRQTVEALLTYGVYAAAFHDDPRYYIQGHNVKFTKRVIYAADRVVLTRKDDGRTGINWPQLAGTASAQAFANVYYPSRDQGVGKTITATLTSYATTAGINELHEFLGDVLGRFHHK